jgi:hypothetical protein
MRLLLLLLTICVSGFGDSLHLKVVLDTNSPAEYNRWLWQHRTECPGFKHVYITEDSWVRRGRFERPVISFWTDSGPLLMHCILPDSQRAPSPMEQTGPILDISRNLDQLILPSGGGDFAVYNRFGTRLFTDPHRPEGLMAGRWMTFTPYPFREVLLDDNGKVLSTISLSGIPNVLYADDSVFAIQDNDGTVVLFDRDGHELWRSRKLGSRSAFAVGSGGRAVAASTGDSLMIFNPPGATSLTLPHDKEWRLFGNPTMAWSADGKRLAICQGSQTAWDSGRVFVVNTRGQLVRPARKMRLYNVRSLLWMGDTLVLPAVNVDFSHTDPRISYARTIDSCVVSFLRPGCRVERGTIQGKFKIYGPWAASGRYLAYAVDRHYLIAEFGSGRSTHGHSGSPR